MKCKKCGKDLQSECICSAEKYLKIGDVSACQFLDKHVSYEENAGSSFFQGWGFKHIQMKYKLHLKNEEIKKLKKQSEDLKNVVKKLVQLNTWPQRYVKERPLKGNNSEIVNEQDSITINRVMIMREGESILKEIEPSWEPWERIRKKISKDE